MEGRAVEGQGPAQEPARRRGAHPRAGARRGVPGRHGQQHQLQHGVVQHLRAGQHVRPAGPPGSRERVGEAPRSAVPGGRQRRVRRGAAGRHRGAQLEAGRPGDRALQPRRRPGPERARRLDDGHEPAHLGLRDQLRRPRRPGRGEGQPADAEAGPPDVGGGGGERAVQQHQLPHARRPQRRADEAGRRRAHLGRHRRHRRLRHAVRAQRRRHPGVRRVVARQGRHPAQDGRASTSSTAAAAGYQFWKDERTHDETRVAPAGQGHPRPVRRRPRHRVRAPGPFHVRRVDVRRQARRHRRHVRGHQRLHDGVRQPPLLDAPEAARRFATSPTTRRRGRPTG